ncbi:MAG: Ig-like domain-containing protein, partial [Desulfuromonadales bacterium]|nr:Ig-like domain-containing protein [Desulfuromonadales bacterium]
ALSVIHVYLDGSVVPIGETTAAADGSWSFTPASELAADQTYEFTVTATDAAGNVSDPSTAFTLTVRTTVETPVISVATDNVGPSGEVVDPVSVSNDGHTNDATPTLKGTTVAGAIITVRDGLDIIATSITADESGDWSFTPGEALSDGTHSFTVMATDTADNLSDYSEPYILHIDTMIDPPTIDHAADAVAPVFENVTSGGYTNDNLPTLHGTAEKGSTVSLWLQGVVIATVGASATTGEWSIALADELTDSLAEGEHTFTATAVDAAGNLSGSSLDFVLNVDTVSPDAPAFTVDDNVEPVGSVGVPVAVANGGYTNDTTPTLSGTVEAFGTVIIEWNGSPVHTIETDETGTWSYTSATLANGLNHTFTVTVTDRAGNVSEATEHVVHIDTAKPAAPSITLEVDVDNIILGSYTLGGVEAEATVEQSSDGLNWQAGPLAFSEGLNTIYVRQTDRAGNVSDNAELKFIYGTDGVDTLTGDENANILIGRAGDDTLEGKGGGDTLYGDGGNNTASYASAEGPVTASLTDPTDNQGDASGDSYYNIHNLTGSAHADHLIGDDGVNILNGGG